MPYIVTAQIRDKVSLVTLTACVAMAHVVTTYLIIACISIYGVYNNGMNSCVLRSYGTRFETRFYGWHLTIIARQFWVISVSQFAEQLNPVWPWPT